MGGSRARVRANLSESRLVDALRELPSGQARVVHELVGTDAVPTYRAVADALGIHLGTVHRHLSRIRKLRPDFYAMVMVERQLQLGRRHREALLRAQDRSEAWHRKQSARHYYRRFGRWPWERRLWRRFGR